MRNNSPKCQAIHDSPVEDDPRVEDPARDGPALDDGEEGVQCNREDPDAAREISR